MSACDRGRGVGSIGCRQGARGGTVHTHIHTSILQSAPEWSSLLCVRACVCVCVCVRERERERCTGYQVVVVVGHLDSQIDSVGAIGVGAADNGWHPARARSFLHTDTLPPPNMSCIGVFWKGGGEGTWKQAPWAKRCAHNNGTENRKPDRDAAVAAQTHNPHTMNVIE